MLHNFSYLIDGALAGCAHPESMGDLDGALADLEKSGIGGIVSLDEEGLPLHLMAEHGFHHLHLPIPDFGIPTFEQARQFVAFVSRELGLKRAVVAHCRAGYGRTGTMLAVFLAAEGHDARDAIARVRNARPGSIETREQEEFVMDFALSLHGKNAAKGGKLRAKPGQGF
jgi:protein-tyrosine phosphatase